MPEIRATDFGGPTRLVLKYKQSDGGIHVELTDNEEDISRLKTILLYASELDVILAFDFEEPLKSLWSRLTAICQAEVAGKPEDIVKIDSTANSEAGLSILQSPLLREVLIALCVQGNGIKDQSPYFEELIRFLAPQGPSSHDDVTYKVRRAIRETHGYWTFRPCTVAALMRNDWWPIIQLGTVNPISRTAASIFRADHSDLKDQIDLFDLMIEKGGAQAMRDDFPILVRAAVRHAPVEVLEHVLQTIPLIPTLAKWQADELVSYCMSGITEEGHVEMLQFLLDQGLDVDAVAKDTIGETLTALHGAARRGDLKAVRLLWSRGAKVYWDGSKRNALELARMNDQKAIVYFLEKAFDARGIPYGFGEEAPKVPEREAFFENARRSYQTKAKKGWWRFWK